MYGGSTKCFGLSNCQTIGLSNCRTIEPSDHRTVGLSIGSRPTHIVLSFLFCFCSDCVLCAQCCQFLWLVHSCLPLWYYLTFICRWNRAFSCVKHPLRDRNISLLWTDSLNRMNKTNTHVLSLTNGHNKTRTAINCFLHGD